MKYVLALDQGTTSSRSIIVDSESNVVSFSQKEYQQIFPKSGWVEHDPLEIWESQKQTAIEALGKSSLNSSDIAAAGITNQRETTIVWDRKTGIPIYNAIVWQDCRTSAFCNEIKQKCNDLIRLKTGLEADAYFSASKINWILENVKDARQKAENGELCFGTVDTWLVWKLSNSNEHLTDVSNASRTMLFNISTLEWDDELLDIFGVPKQILPEVKTSSEVYCEIKEPYELSGIKISGIAGDQQAALFGQTCFSAGAAKNTYGTGCFMLLNTGQDLVKSNHKLLTTIAWQIDDKCEYALEGSVFIGGAVVQWLRDSLEIINNSNEIEKLADSIEENDGVYFVPAFAGLGTPHWNQEARGLIIGLTRGTGKAHIARAALESIAFQTADLLDAMQNDFGIKMSKLIVDGGAVQNDILMQFQSDILQIPVVRSKTTEATALGAAYLAGLATGVWETKEELNKHWNINKTFSPKMPSKKAQKLRVNWDRAVKRSLDWSS